MRMGFGNQHIAGMSNVYEYGWSFKWNVYLVLSQQQSFMALETNRQWGTTIDPDLQETSITGFTTVEHSQTKVKALFPLPLTVWVQIRL